jgi:hypothetical protein
MPFTSVGNSVFLEWNTVKDVECHTGVKDIQISGNIGHKTQNEEKQTISGNIGHKTQNEEKQTNLGQHWAQNTERREANKSQATLGTKHRTKRS